MPRFKLLVEYDGGAFAGWQRQANGPSVQQALEEAALAFSGETVEVVGAGRTDSGVHALAMAAHLDLASERFDGRTVRAALDFHLRPTPVSVLSAEVAPPGFHARFSAVRRRYLYRILNRRAPPALSRGRVWHVARPLDAAAMAGAGAALLGRHDFSSFRAAGCQAASPTRTLDRLDVFREGEEVRVVAEARSFLYRQVRNIVGSLGLVGEGKWTRADIEAALAARDRAAAGPAAPAEGLYLAEVGYE